MEKYWELDIDVLNEKNSDIVRSYLSNQKKEGKSQHTIIRHRNLLIRFFKTHSKIYIQVTKGEIVHWLTELGKDCTERTIDEYKKVLRDFYNYTVMEKYMEESPLPCIKKNTAEYWLVDIELLLPENTKKVNAFLLNQKEENRSKSTIFRQRTILKHFFAKQSKELNAITKVDIKQWIQKRKKKYDIAATDYLKFLNVFFNYAVSEKWIEVSPLHDSEKMVMRSGRYWELKLILPNHENQTFLNQYLLSMKVAERKKSSIVNARCSLQYFFKNNPKPFSSITREEIDQWFREKCVNRKDQCLSVLRSFYQYCWEEGIMDNPPLRKKAIYKNSAERYWEILLRLPNEENMKVINEFLLNLKDKEESVDTIIGYRAVLQTFFHTTSTHFTLIESKDIEAWLEDKQGNVTEKTIENYKSLLRCFYGFCHRKGYMDKLLIKNKWEIQNEEKKYWKLTNVIKNLENREVINEYLLNMKVTNLSRGTIILHKSILGIFFKEREKFSAVSSNDVLEFLVHLQGKLKATTVKNYISTLSSFFTFCVEEGYMKQTPIKSRWFPKLPKGLPKYLEKNEVVKIRHVSEREYLRNRVIVEFLLSSGCRVGEIHLLNKSDIDLENRTAIVTGKGKKIRRVHFSETCAILLERYFKTCQYDDHPAAILSKRVSRLSTSRIYEIVRGIGEEAGIVGTLHPHRFRHTFATDLITKGANLSFIADELGHTSLETTRHYARLPKWKLIKLYRMYMG